MKFKKCLVVKKSCQIKPFEGSPSKYFQMIPEAHKFKDTNKIKSYITYLSNN